MEPRDEPVSGTDEFWRMILLGQHEVYARTRNRLKHIPSAPRCKMCAAPFAGIGAPFMRLVGRHRWQKNPKYCGLCFDVLAKFHGGAEIDSSFLFVDVRGSTTMAEGMSPMEFRTELDRFYDSSSAILVNHDAIVDKFVGDEVIGMFIPALAGDVHARSAIDAGRDLLREMSSTEGGRTRLPIGIGVHTGIAFVGAVGAPPVTELTALGDVVNTTARLASVAGAGEMLVTEAASSAAGEAAGDRERRSLSLKGKAEPINVIVETLSPVTA